MVMATWEKLLTSHSRKIHYLQGVNSIKNYQIRELLKVNPESPSHLLLPTITTATKMKKSNRERYGLSLIESTWWSTWNSEVVSTSNNEFMLLMQLLNSRHFVQEICFDDWTHCFGTLFFRFQRGSNFGNSLMSLNKCIRATMSLKNRSFAVYRKINHVQ